MGTSKKSKEDKERVNVGKEGSPDISELETRLERLKILDLKTPGVKADINKLKRALENDDDNSGRILAGLEKKMGSIHARWLDQRTRISLMMASIALSLLKEKKMDIKSFSEGLEEARQLKKRKNLVSAMEVLGGMSGDFDRTISRFPEVTFQETWSVTNKALDAYEKMNLSGKNLSQARKYFKKTLALIEKKDLDNVLVYSNLLYTTIQHEIVDDLSRDRFKAIKEEIDHLMETMEEYKKFGIEPEGVSKELRRLESSMDPSKYTEAKTTINRLNKNLSRAETEYFRRKGNVDLLETSDLLDEYGSLLDLSEQRKRFDELKKEQTTLPPKKFMEETDQILTDVKDILFQNFREQVSERVSSLNEGMVNIASEDDRKQVEDLRTEVENALENRDISEAMDYLSLAESIMGQSEGEKELKDVMVNYNSFLDHYETLLNEDIELEELKDEISEIERMFLSDEVTGDRILSKVGMAEERIKDHMIDVRMVDFQREKDSVFGLIGSLNIKDDGISRFSHKFDEIEGMLIDLDDDTYISRIEGVKREVDEEISNYFRKNYKVWTDDVQSSIESLKASGVDVVPLQSRLDEAGRHFRERNYLLSGEILRNLRIEISRLEEGFLSREAEETINSAEFLFEEASRSGVDVSTKEEDLRKAKELLSAGNVREAVRSARGIEEDVKSLWMERKRNTLEEDIKGLKDYIDESDRLGLDISEANEIMQEAETLFSEEKFDEVDEMVGKARDSVQSERNQYYSEGAMDSIKKLKDDISGLSDMGVSTLELETMLIEAERQFMNEEYERSYSLTLDIRENLNESRENHLKNRIPGEMDDLLKTMGKLEVMGLETDDVKHYFDIASKSLSEGGLNDTLENLEKAREISEEMLRSHISLTIPETIVEVKKQVETAMGEGLEIDDIQNMLEEAEELFHNEEYDQAMYTIERAQDHFNTKREVFLKSQFQDNLASVERIMESVTGLENEMELSRDNINMARDAFERGDYQASHRLMQKIMTFMERSMDNKEVSKRREIVQTYYDEVRTLLMVTEGENIPVDEEKRLFSMAGELMAKGDFDQAEHVLEGVKISLNDKRVQMKKHLIESSIQTSEILLKNLSEMGVDITYERRLIEQLKEALRRGDLDRCEDINYKLTDMLRRNQGPVQVQKVQKDLSELRARIVDATSKGIDVKGVQTLLSKGIELFELGDIEGSQEKIEQGKSSLSNIMNDHLTHEYSSHLDRLRRALSQLSDIGIPTDDEETIIKNTENLLREGEVEDAISWIQVAHIGAEAKLNTFQSATAEGYITQIRTYLDELVTKGIDIDDLLKIFEEGLELHSEGSDDKAVSRFSSILELGEELRTLHEMEDTRELLEKHKRLYHDLLSVGMKRSKKVNGYLKDIQAEMSGAAIEPEKLKDMVDRLGAILRKRSAKYRESLARKHISEARKNYDDILKEGLEDPSIPGKIKEAGKRFRNKEFEDADRIAMEIFDGIERLKMSRTGMILKGEISQVKQMLTRLKTLGSNVSHADNLLSRAEATLEDGRVDNAEKLIRSVRQSIKDIVKRNMRETALETIEFTDAMIHYLRDNFSGIAQTLTPSEEMLDDARELFMEKKFKAAKAKGEEARKAVERLDLQNIKQFLYVFRSMQGEEIQRDVSLRLDELERKNLDVSKARILFDKAKEHFDNDDFDKGRQMITLARIMISELDQQSLRNKAFDELNNAHVEILTRKKQGGNVTGAYKTYNSAKDAFSLREFKKSILLSKRAHYQARNPTSGK